MNTFGLKSSCIMEIDKNKLWERKYNLEAELAEIEEQLEIPNPEPWGASEWKERAIACINNKATYCTTIDILKCLISEGKYERLKPDTRDKYIVGLSVALNGLVKAGYIKNVKIPQLNKGYYYGLPHWFDDKNRLMGKYANEYIKPVISIINKKLMVEA